MPVAEVRHPCVCQLPPERMPTRPETTKYTPTPATTTQIVMRAGVILFLSSPDPPPRRLIRTGYPPPTIAAGTYGECAGAQPEEFVACRSRASRRANQRAIGTSVDEWAMIESEIATTMMWNRCAESGCPPSSTRSPYRTDANPFGPNHAAVARSSQGSLLPMSADAFGLEVTLTLTLTLTRTLTRTLTLTA